MQKKNNSNVFTRSCIVGICSFFYDILEISETRDNIESIIKIPIFYSKAGEEQFIKDLYLDTDKYCNELSSNIEGNLKKIPSGVIKLTGVSVDAANSISGFNRLQYSKEVETEFNIESRDFSSRGELLPHTYDFDITIRCSSDIQRLKIFDALIEQLYKARRFYISYKGFNKIKCTIALPEDYTMEKNFAFGYGDNEKRPEINFKVQMYVYRPVIDQSTEYNVNNTVKDFTVTINPLNPDEEGNINPTV